MLRLFSIIFLSLVCFCANGQDAKAYNVYLKHNVVDPNNNRAMLQVHFKLKCSGILGHKIIPVMFVDKEKCVGHSWDNGGPMKQDGSTYTSNYENTFWESDNWIGIYNDRLNPLPGKHTYWVRVLIWDCDLNRYIGDLNDTEWVTFDYTGQGQPSNQNQVNNKNSNKCPMCGGITAIACTRCGGRGQVYTTYGWVTCNMCQGVGNITCPTCLGSGHAR